MPSHAAACCRNLWLANSQQAGSAVDKKRIADIEKLLPEAMEYYQK